MRTICYTIIRGIIANEEIRKLNGCRCVSNEDKEVLLEALNVRRDILIIRHEPKRLTLTTIEHIESRLDKVEKMIETIQKIPTC